MADDLIQQYAEEDPQNAAAAKEQLYAGLQGHFTSGELDSAQGLISDLGNIILTTVATIADQCEKNGVTLPKNVDISLKIGNQLFVPVSIVVDVAEGETWLEAAVTNMAAAAVATEKGTVPFFVISAALVEKMKQTFLKLTIIIFFAFFMIGCVPYKTTFTNSETLGKRSGVLPNTEVKIERRKKEVHAIALLSPEGIGTKATIVSTYNYYLIEPDGTEMSLSHINKSGTDYAYLHEIMPVSDTPLWVAFWLEGDTVRREYVDLNIIVFDESRVIHRNYIKDSIRTKTCDWEYSSSYSVLPLDGNRKIQFNTKDGTTIYDTIANKFE